MICDLKKAEPSQERRKITCTKSLILVRLGNLFPTHNLMNFAGHSSLPVRNFHNGALLLSIESTLKPAKENLMPSNPSQHRPFSRRGLTLIEIMIALTMTLIVLGAMMQAFQYASGQMQMGREEIFLRLGCVGNCCTENGPLDLLPQALFGWGCGLAPLIRLAVFFCFSFGVPDK